MQHLKTVLTLARSAIPQLPQAGYEVLYQEFNGSHTVPEVIVPKALDWFTASSATAVITWI